MSLPKDFFGFFFFVLCSPPFSVFASSASRPLLLFFLVLWSLFFSLSLFLSLSRHRHTRSLRDGSRLLEPVALDVPGKGVQDRDGKE